MSSALEARLAQEMARKVAIPIAERVAQETAVPVARETATIVAEQTAQDAADAFHAANPPIPGPQGHKGNTGDTGSTGGAGPQGIKGDKGLNWRGPWHQGAYQPDDAVEADGSSYVATAQTRSKPPSSSWDLLAQKGEPGAPGTDGQFHAYPRGGGGVTVQDEGTNVGPVSTLDFEGAGVTVTQPQGGKAVVTIPGGSGSGLPPGGSVGQVVTNTAPGAGDWETPTPVGTPITDTFTGDGAQTTFMLSQTATGTWGIAALNGAQLLPSEFAIAGTSVVFDVAPALAAEVAVTYVFGGGVGAPATFLNVGRPKPDGGDPFYGVPFGIAWAWVWTTFPYFADNPPFGKVFYTPFVILRAIHVTSLVMVVDGVRLDVNGDPADANARLAVVAADGDWQPSGAPVIQATVAVPAATAGGTELEAATDVILAPGLYLASWETDGAADDQISLRALGQFAAFTGSAVCASWGGSMLQYAFVAHVYGPLSDPLPRWSEVHTIDGTESDAGQNGPFYPFLFEWDPL